MLHTKSRRNRSTGSREEELDGFLPYKHAGVVAM